MLNWLVLALWTVVLVVGCQPRRNSDTSGGNPSGPQSPSSPSSPGSSAPTTESKGTADQGGGGNLIAGKPIDFYGKDVTTWDEYTKYIQPIDEKINSIREDHAGRNGVAYLKTIATTKTWYLIPIKIDELDKERIGTGFQSEQAAYQTEKEIFISELVYKNLNEEQKAQLLLHEIIMGFYRVKYEFPDFYCKAMLKKESREDCLSGMARAKDTEEAKALLAQSSGTFLKPGEYESIRHVTEWLFSNYKTLTKKEFDSKMIEKEFDPRIFNNGNFVSEHEWKEEKRISIPDFLKSLEVTALAGKMPQYCGFSSKDIKSHSSGKCKVEVSTKETYLNIKISGSDKQAPAFEYTLILPYGWKNDKGETITYIRLDKSGNANGGFFWTARLTTAEKASHGVRSASVNFNFMSMSEKHYELESIEVTPFVWISSPGDTENVKGFQSENVQMSEAEEFTHFISTKPSR